MDEVPDDTKLNNLISKTVANEHDEMVMTAFRVFNSVVLKTNFYTPTKVALSFRLNPDFLPEQEYPQPLYGMFLVISSEFRGFHLRFRDNQDGKLLSHGCLWPVSPGVACLIDWAASKAFPAWG